jgi:hypothetical protein
MVRNEMIHENYVSHHQMMTMVMVMMLVMMIKLWLPFEYWDYQLMYMMVNEVTMIKDTRMMMVIQSLITQNQIMMVTYVDLHVHHYSHLNPFVDASTRTK